MLQKVLQFYKAEVRTYNLIFRFFKGAYFSFWISYWLFFIAILLMYFSIVLKIFTFWILVPIIITATVATGSFLTINSKAKKKVLEYGIQPAGFLWKTDGYKSYQVDLLQGFLVNHKIQSEAKIKLLIDYLYKEIEDNKLPSFVTPSAFLALFVPLWIQFITYVFKGVSSIEMAVATTMGLAVIILILIASLNIIKISFIEIKDSVISSKIQMMRDLAKLLEDLLLRSPIS